MKLIRFKIDGHDFAIVPSAVISFAEDNDAGSSHPYTLVCLAHSKPWRIPMSFAAFAEAWERAMRGDSDPV